MGEVGEREDKRKRREGRGEGTARGRKGKEKKEGRGVKDEGRGIPPCIKILATALH